MAVRYSGGQARNVGGNSFAITPEEQEKIVASLQAIRSARAAVAEVQRIAKRGGMPSRMVNYTKAEALLDAALEQVAQGREKSGR
jgi:hypothetical protein